MVILYIIVGLYYYIAVHFRAILVELYPCIIYPISCSFFVFIGITVVHQTFSILVKVLLTCLHTVQSAHGTPAQHAGWRMELEALLFDVIARQLIEASVCDTVHWVGLLARTNVFPFYRNISLLCISVFV